MEHLPAFVESLSNIMSQLDDISGIQLISLQNIIIILFKDFHFLSKYHHLHVVRSIVNTFKNIQKLGGKILDESLEKIIFQGIIYTCSQQLTYDLKETIETVTDWKETITFRDYLPLWFGILDPKFTNSEISGIIYDHFIENIFEIINILNLSTVKRKFKGSDGGDREFCFNDPSIDLEPVNPKDFLIFYNLVDFCCEIFKGDTNDENFQQWANVYVSTMCEKSLQNPLISGYLRLLEAGFQLLE